jgi:hypothetical protein
MTRTQAVQWLHSKDGGRLDFDGKYGNQCFDYFNYYYQFITGRNPYSDGYGVEGAKDIWNVPTARFTKVKNDPKNPNQFPSPGDILVYNGTWGGGYGHVEMVISADKNGVTVSAQNSKGQYVDEEFRSWGNIVNGLIGWLVFNNFSSATSTGGTMVTKTGLTYIFQAYLGRNPDAGAIAHYVGKYDYDFTLKDVSTSAEAKKRTQAKANEIKSFNQQIADLKKQLAQVPASIDEGTAVKGWFSRLIDKIITWNK